MKKAVVVYTLVSLFVLQAYSQGEKRNDNWTVVGNVQYVTQHYWRGLGKGPLFGEAPAFEPSVMFFNKNWNMGLFAAGSFDGIYKVMMPWISFSPVKNLWIGIWDIYSPGRKLWTSEAKPFDFGLTTSNHFVDAMVSYQLPWFPLSLKWATLVAGKDPNAEGKRNFTTYTELSYTHRWNDFSVWGGVGITPWKGLYYGKKSGVNNLELKLQYNFRLYEPITLPLFTKIAYNPLSEQFHFLVGANLIIPYTFK
jgi:hypothetical protein